MVIVREGLNDCSDHSRRKPLVEKGGNPTLRSLREWKSQGDRVEKLLLDHRHWHLNDRVEKLLLDHRHWHLNDRVEKLLLDHRRWHLNDWCLGPMHLDDRVEKLVLDPRHWHLNLHLDRCLGPMHLHDDLLGLLSGFLLLLGLLLALDLGEAGDDLRLVHDLLLGHRLTRQDDLRHVHDLAPLVHELHDSWWNCHSRGRWGVEVDAGFWNSSQNGYSI